MSIHPLPTHFAPAGRASQKRLVRQSSRIASLPLMRPMLDAVPDIVLVLNPQRQIVFANRALDDLIRLDDLSAALGLRPGEALDCAHAAHMPGGCGTSEYCRACGAARAILSGLAGEPAVEECRIRLKNGDALDLQVHAVPLELDVVYAFLVLKDISHEKRRHLLERIFFHDILNSAGALRGLSELLRRAPQPDKDDIAGDIYLVSDRLVEEIQSQKMLVAAETNELRLERNLIPARQFLEEIIHLFQGFESARRLSFSLDPASCSVTLVSDRALLQRVLGNMVKNAIEACQPGDVIHLGCRQLNGWVEFWVQNPGEIPEQVRLQIFQRSFSTKGPGRGLGAYSIKLLGERYLGGQVSFTTSTEQGTIFKISLPLE